MEIINYKGKYYFKTEKGYREVLATTDKSLTINSIYGINSFDAKMFGGKSEVIKLPQIFNLPQPSQSFIEYFVSEYNQGNIITEVMVEYLDSVIIEGNQVVSAGLKLSKDNTINIKPIKDSWNREEVIKLFNKCNKDLRLLVAYRLPKWIEENL